MTKWLSNHHRLFMTFIVKNTMLSTTFNTHDKESGNTMIKLKSLLAATLFSSVTSLSINAADKSYLTLTNAEKPIRQDISQDFSYPAKQIKVKDALLQYYERGEGDPIIFLHGIPVWSYLWRNVMPYMESEGRVIALDLPGYGYSERGAAKSFSDHVAYFEAFIEELGLKNITLVIHDLGGAVGVAYAAKHPDKVKAVAFGESPFGQSYTEQPLADMVFPEKASERRVGFYAMMHNDESRENAIIEQNMFMTTENFTYGFTRQLTKRELSAYQVPFSTKESRYAISDVVKGLELDGKPVENYELLGDGLRWLTTSKVPKLMFTVSDGNLLSTEVLKQIEQKVPNLTTVALGQGRHFFQEEHPHKTGKHLKSWYQSFN